jgi:hypothetical protein
MNAFKLTDILKSVPRGRAQNNAPVAYSWHKKGRKSTGGFHALCVFFSADILAQARYRQGDNVDVVFYEKAIDFILSPSAPFSIYKSSGSKLMMKVSTAGIEEIEKILPNIGEPVALPIVNVTSGAITCKIP